MRKFEVAFFTVLMLCLSSCKDNLGPCSSVICADGDEIAFTIVDSAGKSLLGQGKKYNPDSVMFFNDVDTFNTEGFYNVSDTIQELYLDKYTFSEEIFVRLDSVDYDTLHFYAHNEKGECCTSFVIDSIEYRNAPVRKASDEYGFEYYVFEK